MAKNAIDQRLEQLGIELPNTPAPMANYVPSVQTGNLLYLSGQGPRSGNNQFKTGKVGGDVTVEEAYQHARLVGLQLLSAAKTALNGDLSRVKRVVKLLGMVNGTPEFDKQPQVINGCSDLMVEVFGDAGKHARSAVGVPVLPLGAAVEVDCIVAVGSA